MKMGGGEGEGGAGGGGWGGGGGYGGWGGVGGNGPFIHVMFEPDALHLKMSGKVFTNEFIKSPEIRANPSWGKISNKVQVQDVGKPFPKRKPMGNGVWVLLPGLNWEGEY